MSKSGVESYFRHYHLQDLLDHFVGTFIEAEQNQREIAARAYLLKNTMTTDVNVEDQSSSRGEKDAVAATDASGSASEEFHYPQQKAIRALREFLEAHARGHEEWRAGKKYVVLIPSAVPCRTAALGDRPHSRHVGHPTDAASLEITRACAKLLQDEHQMSAVEMPCLSLSRTHQHHGSIVGSTGGGTQMPTPRGLADIMLAQEDLDEGDVQKLLDAFRLVTAEQVRERLQQSPNGTAVIVASQWPRAVADALVMEHLLGQPQGVFCINPTVSPAALGTIPSEDEEPEEDLACVIAGERREAGFVNAKRERLALLAYYRAVGILQELTLPAGEEAIAAEKVMYAVNGTSSG